MPLELPVQLLPNVLLQWRPDDDVFLLLLLVGLLGLLDPTAAAAATSGAAGGRQNPADNHTERLGLSWLGMVSPAATLAAPSPSTHFASAYPYRHRLPAGGDTRRNPSVLSLFAHRAPRALASAPEPSFQPPRVHASHLNQATTTEQLAKIIIWVYLSFVNVVSPTVCPDGFGG